MNSCFQFLAQAVRRPVITGAFWPSSKALSRAMVNQCDFLTDGTVVELGAGTGAFTELLLERLNGRKRFLTVEINRAHAAFLRRRFPGCEVIHDSAENLSEHLCGASAACIVSGLPWGNMFARRQARLLNAILQSLAPGGQFLAFGYAHAVCLPGARRFRALLARHFDRIEFMPIVWRNLPPAQLLSCRMRGSSPSGAQATAEVASNFHQLGRHS